MKKRSIFTILFSFLFSIMIFFTLIIGQTTYKTNIFIEKFRFKPIYIIAIIILTIILYFIFRIIFNLISKININKSDNPIDNRKIFIISFICIFITGMLFLITYYPGTCMVDTEQIIADPITYSNQYPIIYSLISSFIFNISFKITNSSSLSFFMLSFIQLILMSIIISYVIYFFHKKIKSNLLTIITIIYFTILPIFSNLNITHLKDTIFSGFILLLISILYEIIESNGNYLKKDKNRFILMFISMCMIFTRNNAIIILLVLILVLLIKYKKYYKYFVILLVFILMVSNIKYLLPKKYHKKGLYQESISHPIQQLAFVNKYKKISLDDEKFLNNIMNSEIASHVYDPYMVDTMKWNPCFDSFYLDEHKKEFNKIWFKYLKKYPSDYLKAYILNTYDLWSIGEFYVWESNFFVLDSTYKNLDNKIIIPKSIYRDLDSFYRAFTIYLNNGCIFFIYLFLFLTMIYKNKSKYFIIFISFFTLWINHMCATPLASAFRYMSPLGYSLPFIMSIIFIKDNKKVV